ncbi:hypothetical protein IW136_000912 [Coemansia sp. RSA 678]|nr:hypothetical protein IW136_000912 [Coemansia sp. RSA 678]
MDYYTKESRGFGYIEFYEREDAEAAYDRRRDIIIRRKPVTIEFARGQRKNQASLAESPSPPSQPQQKNIVVTRVAAVQVIAAVVAAAAAAAVVARRRDGAAGHGAGTRGRAVARAAGADMAQDGGVAGGAVGAIRAARAATAVVAAAVGATVAHVEDTVARAAAVAPPAEAGARSKAAAADGREGTRTPSPQRTPEWDDDDSAGQQKTGFAAPIDMSDADAEGSLESF